MSLLAHEDALVERIAQRVAELIREADDTLLTTEQAANRLGRSRQWVYEHQAEIGAVRMGDGPKARLGIPAGAIERYLREQATPTPKVSPERVSARRRHRHARSAKPALKARGTLTRPEPEGCE